MPRQPDIIAAEGELRLHSSAFAVLPWDPDRTTSLA
jgi:hypothetical protein